MPARRILLLVALTSVLGALLSPAQATVPIPIWGVTVSGEDDFGNRIEGRAFFTRVPEDVTTQVDHIYIWCEIHVAPAAKAPAAALGINERLLPGAPSNTDGCYLKEDLAPVMNAPGVGVPGEEAVTTSSPTFYRYEPPGDLEVCMNARGLFTSGGLAEASGCGNVQGEL